MGKKVLEFMFEEGKDPASIVKERNMVQVSDEGALLEEVKKVLAANPKVVEDYRAGKTKILGFAVGQVMKATKGQANPTVINKLVAEELERLK